MMMKKNKKSQGISLTTVVIAAVALVVLIVLILIFSGRLNIFNKAVSECPIGSESKAASELTNGNCPGGNLPRGYIEDSTGTKKYCCPTS